MKNRDKNPVKRPISGFSYSKAGKAISDVQIQKWLITLIKNEGVCYGYRKLTHALRRNYGLLDYIQVLNFYHLKSIFERF